MILLRSSIGIAYQQKNFAYCRKSKGNAKVLDRIIGRSVNNGECYGGTAWYVSQLGGPQLMGSGHMFAMLIGKIITGQPMVGK